jgi:hypothetical protein
MFAVYEADVSGLVSLGSDSIILPSGRQFTKYAFYYSPLLGKDMVSGALIQGNPVIGADGLLSTCGPYTVLNGMSNDISDPYWSEIIVTVLSPNSFVAPSQWSYLQKSINTVDGKLYTVSFYAYVEPGGQLDGYEIKHSSSASGNQAYISLTEERKRYTKTVIGKTGGGVVQFGIADNNISNWSKVYIDTINITATPYAMPPAINTTTGQLSVPSSFAGLGVGPKFPVGSALPDLASDFWTVVGGELLPAAVDLTSDWQATIDCVINDLSSFTTSVNSRGVFTASTVLIVGSYYEISIIASSTSDLMAVSYSTVTGSATSVNVLKDGTPVRMLAGADRLYIRNTTAATTELISVSLKQIQPSQAWQACGDNLLNSFDGAADGVELTDYETDKSYGDCTRISGASYAIATILNDSGYKDGGILIPGAEYEATFRIFDYVEGAMQVSEFSGAGAISRDANGTYTERFTAPDNILVFKRTVNPTTLKFEIISVKEISPAQGELVVEWMPMFSTANVTGVVNILTANDDAGSFLFYNGATQEIHAFDGVNTATVPCVPVAGQLYEIGFTWGENTGQKMQLSLDVSIGSITPYNGRVPVADALSFGWTATDWQSFGHVKLLKEPVWTPTIFTFDVNATQVITGAFSTTVGETITVDWGDGTNDTYTGTDQSYSKDYGSVGDRVVSIYGASGAVITKFTMTTSGADISFDITNAPSGLTYLDIWGANTVSGDLGTAPSGLTYLDIRGSNTISGDIGTAPSGLTSLLITGSNTISDYITKTWTTIPVAFDLRPVSPGGLSTAEIDQLLIDLDTDLTWTSGTITLTGTNAPRSAASDAAVANLILEGVTVTTTP